MKTKATSVEVFEVRLWSKKHYGKKVTQSSNIFDSAQIANAKTKEHKFVNTAAEFLTVIEKMYRKAEREKKNE